jgi:hypothetical protein
MNDDERARLHTIIKTEFAKHRWDTFVDEPPGIAQGGRGVVVPARNPRTRSSPASTFPIVPSLSFVINPELLSDRCDRRCLEDRK